MFSNFSLWILQIKLFSTYTMMASLLLRQNFPPPAEIAIGSFNSYTHSLSLSLSLFFFLGGGGGRGCMLHILN